MKNDILSIYCPSCASPAQFDIVKQVYNCSYCGGKVVIEDAKKQKAEYRVKVKQKVKKDLNSFPLMTSTCTGCGAKLVFEENEAVTTCDFCGRKLVRKKYTSMSEVPESIIPFALTMDDAKEKLSQWCKQNSSKSEAKKLLNHIDHLQGYYLPYHMTRGPVSCDVKKTGEVKHFLAHGYLENEFVNCSSQVDNLLLDAMEPYDLNDLKEFDYGYIAGQRVKITDISQEDIEKRLKEEVTSNYKVYLEKIWGSKALDVSSSINSVVESSTLLPVYFIKEDGVVAAVNGQTGKVSVQAQKTSTYIDIPWWFEAILLFILACGLVFTFGYLSSKNFMDTLAITGVVAGFYFFVFCFMFEPGLDNSFRIVKYKNIYTSGKETFKREKGKLVLRDEILKRKISEPVFFKVLNKNERKKENIPVTYVFRSTKRILIMIAFTLGIVFLPVILALFVNGFDFSKLNILGSGVWFCVTVPTAPIVLIQSGFKELYENPWTYTFNKDGKKVRDKAEVKGYLEVIKDILTIAFLNPVGWIGLLVMGVQVYLTAFGF